MNETEEKKGKRDTDVEKKRRRRPSRLIYDHTSYFNGSNIDNVNFSFNL